jgi:hypothetical protein
MWNIPVSLIAGGSDSQITITDDTLIGNLWTFMGSLSGPQTVIVTVDGADAGDIQVTADWAGGTTFQFVVINGGRIVGLGGNGGNGGSDFGSITERGDHGGDAGSALSSNGFEINVDIDDGFLLGGGAGGGGGAGFDAGTQTDAGGGGGGGQGFSVTNGGLAGVNIGVPAGTDGGDGGPGGPGAGGAGAGTIGPGGVGGSGGPWGSGGISGESTTSAALFGGNGGRGGSAFLPTNGATIVYSGAKNEATLKTESRLIGLTTAGYPRLGTYVNSTGGATAGSSNVGYRFESGGDLVLIDSFGGNTTLTNTWFDGTGTPVTTAFEIRESPDKQFNDPYSTAPAAVGTWVALTSDRTYTYNDVGPSTALSHIEIRETGSANIYESGYIQATNEGP